MLRPATALTKLSLLALAACCLARPASAYKPESPEVQALIKEGLAYLDEATDRRLGGKCVIGLAYIKSGLPNHARVTEALAACREGTRDGMQGDRDTIYSCGLAIIFLCELDSGKHSNLIDHYLGALERRQKSIGAWGYTDEPIGDTSQTQYGALSLWEAHQAGKKVSPESALNMAHWLIQTQAPSGGWTYKGEPADLGKRRKQHAAGMTLSIGAAAMGSVLMAADLFGLLAPGAEQAVADNTPDALRLKSEEGKRPPLPSSGLQREHLFAAIRDGGEWMTENYKVENGSYQLYYMYGMERYKSLEGVLMGDAPEEPEWYNNGIEWLKQNKLAGGGWRSGCGAPVDTAFAILFMQRSMLKSLNRAVSGSLVSGRGLPAQLGAIKLSRGQIVAKQARTDVDQLVNMLGDEQSAALDALADDPTALVGEIDQRNGRRFEQIARSGQPTARLLAVRALGRAGNLDFVPTLIYAMTDPDRRVVLEARNGLRFTSRKFSGFGLPDDYDDRQLHDSIERWKRWYLAVRPDATFN